MRTVIFSLALCSILLGCSDVSGVNANGTSAETADISDHTFNIPKPDQVVLKDDEISDELPPIDEPVEPTSATSIQTLREQVKALASDLRSVRNNDLGVNVDNTQIDKLAVQTADLLEVVEKSASTSPLSTPDLDQSYAALQEQFFEAVTARRDKISITDENLRAYVHPIYWNRLGAFTSPNEAAQRTGMIAASASRYLIGPSYEQTYGNDAADGYVDLGGIDERRVRYPAMTALTLAISMKLGIFDTANLSLENASVRTLNLIRTIAARHKVNSNRSSGWGFEWQSALWAYYNGFAAWLMWENLTPSEQDKVVKMIVVEADRFLTGNDVYLIGRSGQLIYETPRGSAAQYNKDTKAEENQWNAALLGLAVAMMPEHPNSDEWARRHRELLVAALARVADLTSDETVNGIHLKTWLQGTNITDDGELYNHDRLHPIYMITDQGLYEAVASGLTRQCAPIAAKRNVPLIYSALVDKQHKELGGTRISTIYQRQSPEIFYPQGNDWGSQFAGYFGGFDQLISIFGLDRDVTVSAATWEKLHSGYQVELQKRSDDGRTYLSRSENSYDGKEQRIGVIYTLTYLATRLVQSDIGNLTCWTND